jgi:hypothetical protein
LKAVKNRAKAEETKMKAGKGERTTKREAVTKLAASNRTKE